MERKISEFDMIMTTNGMRSVVKDVPCGFSMSTDGNFCLKWSLSTHIKSFKSLIELIDWVIKNDK